MEDIKPQQNQFDDAVMFLFWNEEYVTCITIYVANIFLNCLLH